MTLAAALEQDRVAMPITPEGATGLAAVAAAVGGVLSRWLTMRAEEGKDVRKTLLATVDGMRQDLHRERLEWREERQALEGRITLLETEADALWKENRSLEAQVIETRGQNAVLRCEKDRDVSVILTLQQEVEDNRDTIRTLQAEVSALKVNLAEHGYTNGERHG